MIEEEHIKEMLLDVRKQHFQNSWAGAIRWVLSEYYRKENYREKLLKDGNTGR
jgi:hypothetical protein